MSFAGGYAFPHSFEIEGEKSSKEISDMEKAACIVRLTELQDAWNRLEALKPTTKPSRSMLVFAKNKLDVAARFIEEDKDPHDWLNKAKSNLEEACWWMKQEKKAHEK